MKIFTNLVLFFFPFCLTSQYSDYIKIDANTASVLVNNDGTLFLDKYKGISGYEIPKGGGTHPLYAGALSIGGIDENGNLRYSILRFGSEKHFKSGPFSNQPDLLSNPNFANDFPKSIWKVSKQQIAIHRANYNNPDYIIPDDILYWPGNGDPKYGISQFIAPFVDLNGDDVYSPENGEYPLIKGDESIFFVMNDQGIHLPNNNAVGVEVRVMISQLKKTNSFLDSSTFVSYKVINKGTHSYDSLYTSFFIDADVGNYQDDYAGTDVLRNMMYFYNGDNNDETNGQNPGYGLNPPAIGVKVLNKSVHSSTVFTSTATYPYSDPLTDVPFFAMAKGKWADGSDKYYGGQANASSNGVTNSASNFMYTGESDLNGTVSTDGIDMSNEYPFGWYESTVNNPPGDRRGLITNKPIKFLPNNEVLIDYAILFGRSSEGQLLSSVNRLQEVADSCQNYYDVTPMLQNFNNITVDTTDYSSLDTVLTSDNNEFKIEIYNGPKLTRLSGYGNGGNYTELTQNCIDSIVKNGYVNEIEFKNGCGPVYIEIIDSAAYQEGDYKFEFYNYSISHNNSIDSAKWRIIRSNNSGTNIYESQFDISIDTFEIIPQFGLKVKVQQKKYTGTSVTSLFTNPIYSSIVFDDSSKAWLTFVEDNSSFSPFNWIRSGLTFDTSEIAVPAYTAPACYKDELELDDDKLYSSLLGGGIAPQRLVGYQCDFQPLAYYNLSNLNTAGSYRKGAHIAYSPSIDIVITSDESKWTRCPVIELGRETGLTVGGAKAGGMRKSPSVGKDGLPDGSGTGMGWFPGYAIDVETGARLYMAFGENSFLTQENGADMIWNPTDKYVDAGGNIVLGGQHPIYVFNYKAKTINNYGNGYDLGAYDETTNEVAALLSNVETSGSGSAMRRFYGNLAWIINPILKNNQTVLESDVKIVVRVVKEYKKFSINNNDEFTLIWNHGKLSKVKNLTNSNSLLKVYPNPSNDIVNIDIGDYALMNGYSMKIINALGQEKFNNVINIPSFQIPVSQLGAKGVYYINIYDSQSQLVGTKMLVLE